MISIKDNSLTLKLKETIGTFGNPIVSFKDCNIEMKGNVEDDKFIRNLGTHFSYGVKDSKLFNKIKANIELYVIPPKPLYVYDFKFDGGKDSNTYNSTILNEIKGLDGYIWKNIDDRIKFSKIRIKLENSNRRNLKNIIKNFELSFIDDGFILDKEYTIKNINNHYMSIIDNMIGGFDYSEKTDEKNVFLVRFKNELNNKIYENIIISYDNKPILKEHHSIIKYIKI